jgi:hypothetical protein
MTLGVSVSYMEYGITYIDGKGKILIGQWLIVLKSNYPLGSWTGYWVSKGKKPRKDTRRAMMA